MRASGYLPQWNEGNISELRERYPANVLKELVSLTDWETKEWAPSLAPRPLCAKLHVFLDFSPRDPSSDSLDFMQKTAACPATCFANQCKVCKRWVANRLMVADMHAECKGWV